MGLPLEVMKKPLLLAVSTFATLATAAGCRRAETAAIAPATPRVTIQLPVLRAITDYDIYIGRTQSVETVEVRARVDGYLDKIEFEEGQEVTKGQLLFVIDPRPYEATIARSKAEIGRYKSQLDLAAVEFRRYEQLIRKGAASKEEFDKSAAARQVAEAGLRSAEAQVMQDQLNLDFTRVTAPIDGRISRAMVTVGNLVIGSVGSPTLLTTIVSVDPMYVYFDIDERSLLRYQADTRAGRSVRENDPSKNLKAARIPVFMGLSAEQGYPHRGYIDFAENTVDASTGTIQVRAVFDNKDRVLTPGLFARVRVEGAKPYDALLVPEVAIGTELGKKFLLVVDAEGTVQYREVELGTLTDDNYRVISRGLGAEDRVIVNGMLRVRPGIKVESELAPAPAGAGDSLSPPPAEAAPAVDDGPPRSEGEKAAPVRAPAPAEAPVETPGASAESRPGPAPAPGTTR